MNKDEQLARLLRLKRFEKPDEEYFEGFVDQFHAYQRRSLATQSATSLWWERVGTAFSALRRPATAWAAVGAYAAVMLIIHAWPAPDLAAKTTVVISGQSPTLPAGPVVPAPSQAPAGDGFRPWQTAIPAGQTMQVNDAPRLEPPAPGKRRTADQPHQLPEALEPNATR